MHRFLLNRIGQSALVIVGVVTLTFVIVRVVPGDPALTIAGPRASQAQLDLVRENLGLNESIFIQYARYIGGLLQGDMGTSLRTKQSVLHDLATVLPASLQLVAFAILLAVLVGIPMGALAARYRHRAWDTTIRILSVLMVSFPVFWLALLVQSYFSTQLGWFPAAGEYDQSLNQTSPLHVYTNITVVDALFTGNWPILLSTLQHLLLPAIVLAAYPAGLFAQMTRAALSDELAQTHTLMERSLGYAKRTIIWRFAMRPSMPPVITALALVFAYSIVNSFLVEAIFNWPGLGLYTFDAIRGLDTPAIAGVTLVVAILYVTLNLIVDIFQSLIDPRVRLR